MQILVMYHARGGTTERVAKEVGKGVEEAGNVTALVKAAEEVSKDDLASSAGIIAGSAVYFGNMAAPLKAAFEKYVDLRPHMEGKVGGAFSVSGDVHGGGETTILAILQTMLIYGMVVAGESVAQGGRYGVVAVQNADKETLASARAFGERIAQLAKKMAR